MFINSNPKFKPKKTVQRKSPGRQNARWGQDALQFIRYRIKTEPNKISPTKEYDMFMKSFPTSPRSKKSVMAQISKQKQIWLHHDSHEIASKVGCPTQTYNQLYKSW